MVDKFKRSAQNLHSPMLYVHSILSIWLSASWTLCVCTIITHEENG